ncbi:dTDP-4-dehydrorhamnose 3,5-epimerase [Rhizobium binxianense]
MKFLPTAIHGAFVVEVSPHQDERGLFARTFCAKTFAAHGLGASFSQCNVSVNHRRGTLRGMHYQDAPQAEAKLVRVTRGRVFDVAVDLRRNSPTFLRWASVELDAGKRNAFYIPEGCAHGFLTLEDGCELFYQMSADYAPELGRCVRWNDPAFGIDWPFEPAVMNERDASVPDYAR